MSDQQRMILEQVARGELTPEDAAARLGDLDDAPSPDPAPDESQGPVRTIKVVGSFRQTTIVGDPSVRSAVAEGHHSARHEGDALVISAEEFVEGDAAPGGGSRGARFQFGSGESRTVLNLGSKPLPLKIRMNPALALQAQLAAGTLKIDGVTGPIDAQVSAGTVRIDGFASPLHIQVAGGTVSATGRLDRGASKIQCEAGKVHVRLEAGSSVKVIGRAGLGKVVLPGAASSAFIGGGQQEATVGDGEGMLEIDASMGLVSVETA